MLGGAGKAEEQLWVHQKQGLSSRLDMVTVLPPTLDLADGLQWPVRALILGVAVNSTRLDLFGVLPLGKPLPSAHVVPSVSLH
jgi:hypothetical protein